jgi:hypothetical protein
MRRPQIAQFFSGTGCFGKDPPLEARPSQRLGRDLTSVLAGWCVFDATILGLPEIIPTIKQGRKARNLWNPEHTVATQAKQSHSRGLAPSVEVTQNYFVAACHSLRRCIFSFSQA